MTTTLHGLEVLTACSHLHNRKNILHTPRSIEHGEDTHVDWSIHSRNGGQYRADVVNMRVTNTRDFSSQSGKSATKTYILKPKQPVFPMFSAARIRRAVPHQSIRTLGQVSEYFAKSVHGDATGTFTDKGK